MQPPLVIPAAVRLLVMLLLVPLLLVMAPIQRVSASCGEYFGDFPQRINTVDRRWEQEFGNLTQNTGNDTREYIVNLALLLPSKEGEGCDDCLLRPVLPIIELAIINVQAMLNEYLEDTEYGNQTVIRFQRIYGDTKCSSTIGPLVAVEMVTSKTRPDVFIGLICKYVLAPVSRYAGVWNIPVITPGGLSEAFNLKVILGHCPSVVAVCRLL